MSQNINVGVDQITHTFYMYDAEDNIIQNGRVNIEATESRNIKSNFPVRSIPENIGHTGIDHFHTGRACIISGCGRCGCRRAMKLCNS